MRRRDLLGARKSIQTNLDARPGSPYCGLHITRRQAQAILDLIDQFIALSAPDTGER